MSIKVAGIGMYLPELIVTNDDLAKIVDTSDEWIAKRTGIKSRRIANGELAYQMGAKAAKMALEDANISIDEVDMILATTMSPDCYTPSVASLIGYELGSNSAAAMDINGACTGFVYAFDIARNFLETKCYRNILIVSTELLSRDTDFEDRSTCVLFGDGAAATVVTWQEGVYASYLGGDSTGAYRLYAKLCHHKSPWDKEKVSYGVEEVDQFHDGYIFMEGNEIYKFAITMLPKAVETVLEKANLTMDELYMLIPHQANERILSAANKKLKLPNEKIYVGIAEYGNISSACIPLGLYHLKQQGKLKPGQKICFAGFGAGLTYGALVFEW
jgi:3-oxoacyl-[acyl-carrier-protein] synthase-3